MLFENTAEDVEPPTSFTREAMIIVDVRILVFVLNSTAATFWLMTSVRLRLLGVGSAAVKSLSFDCSLSEELRYLTTMNHRLALRLQAVALHSVQQTMLLAPTIALYVELIFSLEEMFYCQQTLNILFLIPVAI